MSSEPKSNRTDIAIIGMACRFPGADNYNAFWDNLEKGVSSIKEVPPERWEIDKYYSPDPESPNKSVSKWYGLIEDADKFDNRFFNISPGEARYMDPQQRLLLEEVWHCIEDSGVALKELREKRTDVYVGTADWDYILNALSSDINVHTVLGNHSSLLANRISYVMGLNGASLTLDTACSSSLFAAEKAREALGSLSAEYALVASACVHSHPLKYIAFSKAHIVSPDGRCKTFDKDANGFVLGDGVGVLLLQRLEDAVRGKKHIYGILKGGATNHGGHGITITSPQAAAQADVLSAAYEQAGTGPESISYIEAHGTGTLIGDPVEVAALTHVFEQHTREKQFCTIGSVKTNIGHTGGSAGMAAMIKVLMMMRAKKIPPSLNFNTPNPVIDFEDSPFRVATELCPWTQDKKTALRAGVSAFGFGGANAHMVLEAPAPLPTPKKTDPGLFTLSAKSEHSLIALLDSWKVFARSDQFRDLSMGDICKTLATGRESFPYRFGCIAENHDELSAFLNAAPASFPIHEKPLLCLRIGECDWNGWEDLEPLLENNAPFEREIEQMAAALETIDAGGAKLRGLHRKKWTANRLLYRFMAGYAFLKSFLETGGIVPDLLAGETKESGFLTALALSSALSVEDALGILSGKRDAAHILLRRPEIAVFDPVAGRPVPPFHFDAQYLRNLKGRLSISHDSAAGYLSKAKSMIDNQFTFKNYVAEWDAVLKTKGNSIRLIMEDQNRFENEKQLFCVIIANCIRKLNRKWNLSEKPIAASPEFFEIVDLVTDKVMPKEMALALFQDENPDFEAAADTLNQKNMAVGTRYSILKQQTLTEIEDFSAWLKKTENTVVCDPGGMLCFDFGRLNLFGSVSVAADTGNGAMVEKNMLRLWLKGVDTDFRALYPDGSFQKVPLPVYPFKGESYWLPKAGEPLPESRGMKLHPLIHRNTSDLSEQRFSATFTGEEFFLAHHRVEDRKVLPGVAHLEMARCALVMAASVPEGEQAIVLKNVVWVRPIVSAGSRVDVNIGLFPLENGEIGYEIYDGAGPGEAVFSQGTALLKPVQERPVADIEALKAQCSRAVIPAAEHYERLKKAGLDLGASFQGIDTIYVGEDCALAHLTLPSDAQPTMEGFVLHPGLLDSALQAASCLFDTSGAFELSIPFSLKSIEIFSGTATPMWSLARKAQGAASPQKNQMGLQQFDVELYDGSGSLCARVMEIAFRKPKFNADAAMGTLMLRPLWKEERASGRGSASDYHRHLVLVCGGDGVSETTVKDSVKGAEVRCLTSDRTAIDERFQDYAVQTFEAIQTEIRSPAGIPAGKPGRKKLVQVVLSGGEANPWLYALSGLLKTARLENPGLICQLIETDLTPAQDKNSLETIGEKLAENGACPDDSLIRYAAGKRWVERFEEVQAESGFSWKDGCICLITGGLGGLGRIFAREISQKVKNATLILTGRSEPDAEKLDLIHQLTTSGARVDYQRMDVGKKEEVASLISHICKTHGRLTGVIHSAGVISDNFMVRKSLDEFETVMAPKVRGLVNLDLTTREQPLDFFIIFSSMAGSLGNIGQADYACANAFAGGYAAYRNQLTEEHHRKGRTVSIHWPLWKDGGMKVGTETETMMWRSMGMAAMGTRAGIKGFYRSMSAGHPHIMVIGGHIPTIRQKMVSAMPSAPLPAPAGGVSASAAGVSALAADGDDLQDYIRTRLFHEISRVMGTPKEAIDGRAALETYGFDSISLTEFTNKLNADYGLSLVPTLFFEYPDVDSLSGFLATEHGAAFAPGPDRKAQPEIAPPAPGSEAIETPTVAEKIRPRFAMTVSGQHQAAPPAEPVAIVGISGRFPMAEDIGAFWENLAKGKHCITEIPKDRWDWKALYGDSRGNANTTDIKWGGFINGVQEFDPSFFGISPREAELMDPQQRLMLIYAWKAIEDAGIPAGSLAGTKTGVFVGTGGNQYAEIITRANIPVESYTSTGSVPSVGPNRLSYFLDIHGPSEPVETSCSSSLVALHRAVEAMANGSCDMALVGGVNTIITPGFHLSFGNAGMLSRDGKCKTFSDRADGYVRGEAVGMLFLKKLKDARQSNDHIYGVIRGTAVNHGGRASSLTAPNPKAQTEVLLQAYRKAGINPRTIGYIEAHGTGTTLGDPIEIEALTAAFRELYSETGTLDVPGAHCGIGSVKSNIGHTELAAGVAGVIKVLLQIKHRTIAKSLHCSTVNPYIRLDGSPFYIAQEAREWAAPLDAAGQILPRRAGVSSFGFGGANAHVVIEAYPDETAGDSIEGEKAGVTVKPLSGGPYLFVLSAKNQARLKDYARVMADFLTRTAKTDADLADIAYTTQTGREAMEERLGLIVGSVEELTEKLNRFAAGEENTDGLYCGCVRRNRDTAFTADDELLEAADKWIARGKHSKLLSFWVQGLAFDWNRLYGEVRPRRISLPTYPFARDRYWIDGAKSTQGSPQGLIMLTRSWRKKAADTTAAPPEYETHVIALCGTITPREAASLSETVKTAIKGAEVIRLKSRAKSMDRQFSQCALTLFEAIQAAIKTKPKGKILFQAVVFPGKDSNSDNGLFSGLSGLLKTAHLENPKVFGQLIEIEQTDRVDRVLKENSRHPEDAHIRYRDGNRLVAAFEEIQGLPENPAAPWKDGGVYLITGGAGGLGLIFAEEIAATAKKPVLVLTGRSEPGAETQARLEALRRTGARVEFRPSDVTRKADVKGLIHGITSDFGGLNAILHAAGVIRDNFIIHKTSKEFETVLAPKVAGVACLDEESSHLALDFFAVFSSGAGARGNTGQADYACANAFMDAYVLYRDSLMKSGRRNGKTLSIIWAPWKEGGMPIDMVTKKLMAQGYVPMETHTGIRAFRQALALDQPLVMPLEGDLSVMRRPAGETEIRPQPAGPADLRNAPGLLNEKTEQGLKGLFAEATRVPLADLDPDAPFESFGIDSLMISRLNARLEDLFAEVPKTLFYEYRTLRELTRYLTAEYPGECLRWAGLDPNSATTGPAKNSPASVSPATASVYQPPCDDPGPDALRYGNGHTGMPGAREPIAVIGMSGRYPLANDLTAYWENLRGGKDCIREIPKERWPLDGFFHPDPDEAVALGKSYCRWGGFIDGFADFDPLFFNISPKEGMNMDPQERLFIKVCWEVFEDAGYTKRRLKEVCNGRVGVFAGITKTGYELYGPELWQQGNTAHPNTSFGSLANRVSYLFDFTGPSIPIDTMCSSSLTAIHEACEHLYRNECEMAVAGGVNLYLHPATYIRLCSLRMLTADNKNKSFGRGGDGFLPGEGAGAVLLKPLGKALADGDPIHALIRGTGINHGGRTSGYTIPSPVAQAELIRSVMEKAGVTARQITYVEAHATGTELGDPIEVSGLARAFGEDTMPCAIGSAKSNIGHLEAAAGIAGLTKIVLQMEHGKIAPSLHAKTLNPNIDFRKTPFAVQQELGEWKQPEIDGKRAPRIAGLSSFGAGGANAHLILEEFQGNQEGPKPEDLQTNNGNAGDPAIFVLSARTEERLKAYAAKMEKGLDSRLSLADVAYTAQTGREPMNARIAMIVGSVAEIKEKLKRYSEGFDDIEGLYQGNVKGNKDTAALFQRDEDLQEVIRTWVAKGKYAKLLDFWVRGLAFDWNLLYEGSTPRRISLPTYPFAEERYWPVSEDRNEEKIRTGLSENSSVVPREEPDALMTFEEYLDEAPLNKAALPDEPSTAVSTLVCFLPSPTHQKSILNTLKRLAPKTRVVFLTLEVMSTGEGNAYQRESRNHYRVRDDSAITKAFSAIRRDYGAIDAALYMAALEDPGSVRDYSGIVSCIKAMDRAKLPAVRFLLAAQLPEGPERCYPASWVGFERSLGLVMPRMQLGVVVSETGIAADMAAWTERLWGELNAEKIESAVYKGDQRYVYRIRPTKTGNGESLVKPNHTYLITGGCGGLGSLFARHLVKTHPVNLILTGRSPMDEKKQALLKEIGNQNPDARVAYLQADICDPVAMGKGVADFKRRFGPIAGVIHTAGIQDAATIIEKDINTFTATLRPKIKGTQVLDEVLKDDPLDFICYFSSSAAVLGDFGWCDYAVANRYLSAWAEYRKGAKASPCVILWPLWRAGGMGFDSQDSAKTYLASSGQRLLETHEALALFDRLLSRNGGRQMVLAGDPLRIQRFLGLSQGGQKVYQAMASSVPGKGRRTGMEGFTIQECLEHDVKDHIGRILAIPSHQLDPDVNLAEFGFDSVSLTELGARLSKFYGIEVTPAIFFEYNTIEKLMDYLIENHRAVVSGFYGDTVGDNRLAGEASGILSAALPGTLSGPALPGRFHSGEAEIQRNKAKRDMAAWFKQYPECVPLSGGPLNGGSDKKPCFWIHPLTGSVEPYLKIAQDMDTGLPFFGIRSRGFGTERTFLDTIPEMARYYIDIISGIDPEGPYQLAGFSMGGVIAHEMARQLQAKGQKVQNLLLLEPPFPSGAATAEPVDRIALDPETILTTGRFFLYAHVKKALDANTPGEHAFANLRTGRLNGDALIEHLAEDCRRNGVKQPAELIGRTIKNMCYAFAHNKKALASHTVSPLPSPEAADIYYFTQPAPSAGKPENRKQGTNNGPHQRDALHEDTRRLLGDELTHDEHHYLRWKNVLPGLHTVRVPKSSHFDLLSDRKGLTAIIENCRSIYRSSPHAGLNDQQNEVSALQVSRKGRTVRMDAGQPRKAVAIVGMSGRFPMADDLDEFWHRLAQGQDCITEIPKDRWDWKAFYGDPLKAGNKTKVKWGGFMDKVGAFDPMFFGIAPREAEWMDPQQRLLMLYVWKAMEDAGYAAASIAGTRTAMFIGTGGSGYGNRVYSGGPDLEGYYGTAVLPAMGPNRMSYFLDLHGPSEPVDTTCSSSLVAICKAVEAIESGTCESAIAGGVNLIIDPAFHISLDRLGMLSRDGRCRSFSDRADGYVRGEGVGMLFLKPLDAAEQDGDHIYGVIRGSAVNHGGRANSLTAPNPKAQVSVLTEAYEKAGIDPATVGYIETHGTGTVLGDPIEIDALKTAFKALGHGSSGALCGLGSVKTNIGHLELAAGVAGVIKVLLQIKHKTIVKSLHCETLNPHINLQGSPFYIASASRAWKPSQDHIPRRAGVSAFGAGGVNAHVVIEEYTDGRMGKPVRTGAGNLGEVRTAAPAIFVLSAKDEERLKNYALTMGDFFDSGLKNGCIPDLADVAFTSQVGRDAMEERLALIVNSVEDLRDKLKQFGADGIRVEGMFRGNVKQDKETLALFTADDEFGALLDKWVRRGNYGKLLSLWAKGMAVDWHNLHGESRPGRISLPTYPFAEKRYWITSQWREKDRGKTLSHPLLHENTSDLTEQRFSSVFTGDEFFLADHLVRGKKTMPRTLYLEMARAAACASGPANRDGAGILLKDVAGIKPLTLSGQPREAHISLFPETGSGLGFEIYARAGDAGDPPEVYCRGTVSLQPEGQAQVHDIEAVMATCDGNRMDAKTYYEMAEQAGSAYGPGLRGIQELHLGRDMALARLTLPAQVSQTADAFGLHPALIDSALHASGLMEGAGISSPGSAFSLDRLEIFEDCAPAVWALIRFDEGMVHLDLCDEKGGVLARMEGFRSFEGANDGDQPETAQISSNRKDAGTAVPSPPETATALMTFEEYLEARKIDTGSGTPVKTLLCFLAETGNMAHVAGALKHLSPDTEVVFVSGSKGYKKVSRNRYLVSKTDGETFSKAMADIVRDHGSVDALIYMSEGIPAAAVHTDILHILQAMAGMSAPVRFLVSAQPALGPASCYADAWVGFERSLPMVMPKMQFGVIYREIKDSGQMDTAMAADIPRWIETLWQELCAERIETAVYKGDKRYVYRNRETMPESSESLDRLINPKKTYLITGGCGGLGMLLARYLAETYGVNLILTGRSPMDERKEKLLEEIRKTRNAGAVYVQADIGDSTAMKKGIAAADLGRVSGVIHAAGVESQGDILGKDADGFNTVLHPKIQGTLALDEAVTGDPLDFICYFSSASAILGDFGACDYAVANRFMAAFARYKNAGQAKVKHIVFHWPLWKEGGMGFDSDGGAEVYLKSSGQRLLETGEGLELFDGLLSGKGTQHLVLAGKPLRIRRFLGLLKDETSPDQTVVPVRTGRRKEMKGFSVAQCLEYDLKTHIGSLLGVESDQLDSDANLADFGFDSILFAKFAAALTEIYSTEIPPSIFFGNPTLERLVHYFLQEHGSIVEPFYAEAGKTGGHGAAALPAPTAGSSPRRNRSRFLSADLRKAVPEPIAIIGMSGRFPAARNIDEMWNILTAGKDAVSEIPLERFDWRRYYGNDSPEPGLVSNRCGILPGVSEFDPSFFEISPKEAGGMDPRQRLLLQESWKALEDAGYGPSHLRKNRMGVFVGMESGDYRSLAGGEKGITSDHEGVSAVRLAHFLNFSGPAMAINTSCSSGLVAAHQACASLRTYECDTAITAAVNLLLTPETFISLGKSGMMSSSGRCFAFDKRADGMVPGEAVVSLVLKRLTDAERDNDPVYAVIRGSGINYDGKTSGITAPNQNAQAELLKSVYDRYGIDPETITHIVTHGTGTKLGDSIEINALVDAFKGYTKTPRFCALTSTKTNFGHCFAASGLVSLVGLVQALRHQTIPESIHFSQENDHIKWDQSPFYVNAGKKPWTAEGKQRLGAVSAFGMSGTNAHMVVESHTGNSLPGDGRVDPCYLLVFSAKQKSVLTEKIRDMVAFFSSTTLTTTDLGQISLTLSEGRHHFMHRAAVVVQDLDDAVHVLNQVIRHEKSPKIFHGEVPRGFTGQRAIRRYAENMLEQAAGKRGEKDAYQDILYGLAELYCQGYEIRLNRLVPPGKPSGLRLPTYPFARERHWISAVKAADQVMDTKKRAQIPDKQDAPAAGPADAPAGRIALPPLSNDSPGPKAEQFRPITLSDPAASLSGLKPLDEAVSNTPKIVLEILPKAEPDAASDDTGCPSRPRTDALPEPVLRTLATNLAKALYMDESDIDPDMPFTEMGMDSILGVEWIKTVNDEFNMAIEAIKIYDYPNLREFAGFLAGKIGAGTAGKGSHGSSAAKPPAAPASPAPQLSLPSLEALPEPVLKTLMTNLAEALYMDESSIDPDMPFTEMGMDSILGVEWIKAVNDEFNMAIEAIKIYDYPNLREFAGFLAGEIGAGTAGKTTRSHGSDTEPPAAPVPPASLEELLQKVQQGVLDIDQADQILETLKSD